jgi:predicted ATP-dependent Lon-type protease
VAAQICRTGGLAVIGELNLGGSIEIVPNPLDLVELAIEKGAAAVLMPVVDSQGRFGPARSVQDASARLRRHCANRVD